MNWKSGLKSNKKETGKMNKKGWLLANIFSSVFVIVVLFFFLGAVFVYVYFAAELKASDEIKNSPFVGENSLLKKKIIVDGKEMIVFDALIRHRILELEHDIYDKESGEGPNFRVDKTKIFEYPGRGLIGFENTGEDLFSEQREEAKRKRSETYNKMVNLRVGLKEGFENLLKEDKDISADEKCLILLNLPRIDLVVNSKFISFEYGDQGDDFFVILKDGNLENALDLDRYYGLIEKYDSDRKLDVARFDASVDGINYPFNVYYYFGRCIDE